LIQGPIVVLYLQNLTLLKPANLFLMPNGEIKVIDFGESKDVFQGEREDGGDAATATIRGTP
jgi:serine/threonine protein kinase